MTQRGPYLRRARRFTLFDSKLAEASETRSVQVFTGAAPPPVPQSLVNFAPIRTNNFLGIVVTPGDVNGVSGGTFVPINRALNDGEWRLPSPARDVIVQFAATLNDGRVATSPSFLWPSIRPA